MRASQLPVALMAFAAVVVFSPLLGFIPMGELGSTSTFMVGLAVIAMVALLGASWVGPQYVQPVGGLLVLAGMFAMATQFVELATVGSGILDGYSPLASDALYVVLAVMVLAAVSGVAKVVTR